MKLDINFVRDVLLTFEHLETFDEDGLLLPISIPQIEESELMAEHERSEILYTIRMLRDAGLIACHNLHGKGPFFPDFRSEDGLTFAGHQYLANIRDNTVWKKVIDKVATIGGTVSLSVIKAISEGTVSAILKKELAIL